jgi:hypothetical protein
MKSGWTIGLLATTALLVAVTVIARFWPEVPEQVGLEPGVAAFLEQIPADSPLVLVGRNTAEGISEQWNPAMQNISRQDFQPLLDLVEEASGHQSVPVLLWLLDDFLAVGEERDYWGMVEHYGVNAGGAFAFYLHGAMPVFRLELKDGMVLNALLDRAETESNFQYPRTTVGDVSVRTWPLVSGDAYPNLPALQLGIIVEPHQLTLSLLSDRDADVTRLQRFARQSVSENLTDGVLDNWKNEFARGDLLLGFLDFYRLVQGLLLPEQNRTGRELLTLFPGFEAKLQENVSPACRQEYVQLIKGMPRQIFGATDYAVNHTQVRLGVRSVLSIENADVSEQLQRLPGFLPDYSRQVDDKLVTAALGLNMDELVPALSSLWRQFVNAPFECESLQDWQRRLGRANPMMMGVFTAMASGLQGVGLAVYDVKMNPQAEAGLDGDVLISISAEDPESLATLLTSYAPGLAGQRISADGTPVPFTVPFTSEQFYIAIQGQHIVIYRGDRAREASEAMKEEPLNRLGLTTLGLNLVRTSEALLNSPETMAAASTANCLANYLGLLHMSASLSDWRYSETMNELGWDAQLNIGVSVSEIDPNRLPGDYRILLLYENDCSWSALGAEAMAEGGEGQYYVPEEESGACNVLETDFHWELQRSHLVQATRAQRMRGGCDEAWENDDMEDFSCNILRMDDEGFYCLWQVEGDMELYRYQRQ